MRTLTLTAYIAVFLSHTKYTKFTEAHLLCLCFHPDVSSRLTAHSSLLIAHGSLLIAHGSLLVVGGEFLALVLTGEGAQEGNDRGYLGIGEHGVSLVEGHVAYGLFHGGTGAIVIVGPGEFYVAQARHLEAMTVALVLSLLVAAIVLLGELCTTCLEIVLAQSHELV